MTESYWHSLDDEEWAELIRSEQRPPLDGDPTASSDAAPVRRVNGLTTTHLGVALDAIACAEVLSVDAELAPVVSCLGLPLQIVGGARTRMALERLRGILRDRAAALNG